MSLERKVKIMTVRRRSRRESMLSRVLARAQQLAEEVRQTAERVRQEAQEAHRLTELARQQAERGRELSKARREGARAVVESIKWSVDTAGNGERRASGRDEN